MEALAGIAGLGSIVCAILTLIKIFQDKEKNGVLHGILGIIFCLWAFIWGWINSGRYGNQKVMIIWTICIVIYFVAGGAAFASALNG